MNVFKSEDFECDGLPVIPCHAASQIANKKIQKLLGPKVYSSSKTTQNCLASGKANVFWNLKKEGKIEEMNLVLSVIAENLRVIAICLQAFIPNLSAKILDVLNIDESARMLDFIDSKSSLKSNHKIREPKAIFPRIVV